jgi:virulence-associated protein VagC
VTKASTRAVQGPEGETVQLPKEVAFGEDGLELTVERHGDVVTIYPARKRFEAMIERLIALGPLPEEQKFVRPPFEAPLRPGWIDDDAPD